MVADEEFFASIRSFSERPIRWLTEGEGAILSAWKGMICLMCGRRWRRTRPSHPSTKPLGTHALSSNIRNVERAALTDRVSSTRVAELWISWDKREGSSSVKSFVETIVKPTNESTRGFRDLTTDEVKNMNLGKICWFRLLLFSESCLSRPLTSHAQLDPKGEYQSHRRRVEEASQYIKSQSDSMAHRAMVRCEPSLSSSRISFRHRNILQTKINKVQRHQSRHSSISGCSQCVSSRQYCRNPA